MNNLDLEKLKKVSDKIESINKENKTSIAVHNDIVIEIMSNFNLKIQKLLFKEFRYYTHFSDLANVLKKIKAYSHPGMDLIWAGLDNYEEFISKIESQIINLLNMDLDTVSKVSLDFAPTAAYQELAISNGWDEEYMELAEKADKIIEKIREAIV